MPTLRSTPFALRSLAAALMAVSALVALLILARGMSAPGSMDAVAQYAAARLVASGRGAEIVDPVAVLAAEREAVPERVALLPFVQPPAVALLLAPIGALPFGVAYPVMVGLDAAMLVAAVFALAAALRPAPIAVAFALLAPPAAIAVAQGQTSPLTLLLVAISLRARPGLAGLALGLTLLRPQTAPLLLLAGLADGSRARGTAVGAGAVILTSLAVIGPDRGTVYLARLREAGEWSLTGAFGLGSSIGWSGLAILLGAPLVGVVLVVASLLVGSVAVLRERGERRVVVAAVWSILASPHALIHDALLLYPAFLVRTGNAASAVAWSWSALVAWLVHLAVGPAAIVWNVALAAASFRPRTRLADDREPR